ncbi:MAG: hypothetical protein AAFW65_06105 [Pseudomonadota bacterium]
MLRTTALIAAMAAFAAPAFAASTFVAQLETPVAEQERFVANKALWSCEGDTCTAELKRKSPTVRSCRKFVKEIGPVTTFATGDRALSEEDVAACNESAKR